MSFCMEKRHAHIRCNEISAVDLDRALCFAVKFDFSLLGRTYIEMGANLNCRSTSHGETVLHLAVAYNSINAVKCLIQHGARLTTVDGMGFNALHWAAYFGHTVAAKYLIDAGANVNARREEADTSADVYEELSIPLLESFLEPAMHSHNDGTERCIFRILELGSCQSSTSNTWKPLSIAMEEGNADMQQLLLRSGGNTDCSFTTYGQDSPSRFGDQDSPVRVTNLCLQRFVCGLPFQRTSDSRFRCNLRRSSRLRAGFSQEMSNDSSRKMHIQEHRRRHRTRSQKSGDRICREYSSSKYYTRYCANEGGTNSDSEA